MNREDILAKSKRAGVDERVAGIEIKAISFGGLAATVLIGLFIVANSLKGQRSSDLLSILLIYWSAQYFYKYKQLERKLFLVLGCITAIGFVACVVSYILWG